jgi:hypothetical protein
MKANRDSSSSIEMMGSLEMRSVERRNWKNSSCGPGTLMLMKESMMNSGTTPQTVAYYSLIEELEIAYIQTLPFQPQDKVMDRKPSVPMLFSAYKRNQKKTPETSQEPPSISQTTHNAASKRRHGNKTPTLSNYRHTLAASRMHVAKTKTGKSE